MGVKLVYHVKRRTQIVFENRVLRRLFGPKKGQSDRRLQIIP
jgi:hypothetical protein